MSSFLYHGYDMSNTSKYIIDCKDCPKKVKVFQAYADSEPTPQSKNIGRYYYSCKETNGQSCKCKFFRWFEHKWPKVKDEYQHQINEVDTGSTPIDSEMSELIEQMQYIEMEQLSEQDKIEINSLVSTLESKITNSNISQSKKTKYLGVLVTLKQLV
jgi:hypothetical protein